MTAKQCEHANALHVRHGVAMSAHARMSPMISATTSQARLPIIAIASISALAGSASLLLCSIALSSATSHARIYRDPEDP